jgi:hypothetical protein
VIIQIIEWISDLADVLKFSSATNIAEIENYHEVSYSSVRQILIVDISMDLNSMCIVVIATLTIRIIHAFLPNIMLNTEIRNLQQLVKSAFER